MQVGDCRAGLLRSEGSSTLAPSLPSYKEQAHPREGGKSLIDTLPRVHIRVKQSRSPSSTTPTRAQARVGRNRQIPCGQQEGSSARDTQPCTDALTAG